jgi:protoporphyrinogen oxidase
MKGAPNKPSRAIGGKQKVAIIGTGLAGLHAAYLLTETAELRQRFGVHLFEKGDRLGLDGSSVSIEGARIDVPLRSFNAGELGSFQRSASIFPELT